ncbi:CHAD domain containing protein [Candidatus Vecturithrix granuli]|uniref:CHAD domain containing protein n=1 Tax=Vecturithrix granuli TaxID=1499967 RepID=A0A0S6WB83_VECG1|nr:CHAD domain containing protein [Candidatus Vecturithrix granuli]
MFQKCLGVYYAARCKNIQKHFEMAVTYFDVNAIHDLRVEIKRLRSFFQLIEWITPAFPAKPYMRQMRKLFKSAAELRDIHVQQQLTRAWSQSLGVFLSEYYNILKQKELSARKRFAAFASQCDLHKEFVKNEKRVSQAFDPLSKETASTKIQERIEHLLRQILEYGENGHQENNLHKVRILTKETRYIAEIANKCFPELGYGNLLIQQLKGIHQTLGHWHDIQVAFEHLENFEAEYGQPDAAPPFTTQEVYARLSALLEEQQKSFRQDFDRRWEEFMTYINAHSMICVKILNTKA